MAQSQPASARDAVRATVPDLIGYTEKWLFGEVWERPQLSKRDRSLIVVATLIALVSVLTVIPLLGMFLIRKEAAFAKSVKGADMDVDALRRFCGWIAGQMAASDELISAWVQRQAPALTVVLPALCAIYVYLAGRRRLPGGDPH